MGLKLNNWLWSLIFSDWESRTGSCYTGSWKKCHPEIKHRIVQWTVLCLKRTTGSHGTLTFKINLHLGVFEMISSMLADSEAIWLQQWLWQKALTEVVWGRFSALKEDLHCGKGSCYKMCFWIWSQGFSEARPKIWTKFFIVHMII